MKRLVQIYCSIAFASALLAQPTLPPDFPPPRLPAQFDPRLKIDPSTLPSILHVSYPGTQIRSNHFIVDILATNITPDIQMAWSIRPALEDLRSDKPPQKGTANWMPFSDRVEVDLGQGDGIRMVAIGLKGTNDVERWTSSRITVDTTPPVVVLTKPFELLTSQPNLHVYGYSPEELSNVAFDFVNGKGFIRDEQGYITERVLDKKRFVISKTLFECHSLPMAEGTNTLVLHATDRAGNTTTTNFTFVFDLSHDKTPPEFVVHFPKPDAEITAKTFLIRGVIDDPTARIEVTGLTKEPIRGIVERDGHFWIEHLPVPSESTELTLTATDAAGNATATTLSIYKGPVEIVVDTPPDDEKRKRKPRVTGTVSDPEYVVWVNGVAAQMNGTRWVAENVPINQETGTAILDAVAIPKGVATNPRNKKPTLEDMGNPEPPRYSQRNRKSN